VTAFRKGEQLDEYIRLRELPDLDPDPAWLDTHWNLLNEILRGRVDSWIEAVGGPFGPEQPLPPVDELRERGRRAALRTLDRARVAVEAWLHRNAGGQGKRPGDPARNIETMVQSGFLDFDVPRSDVILRWLRQHDQWPEGMPTTTEPRQLQLNEAAMAAARKRLDATHDTARRHSETIHYGEKTYSTDQDDRTALIQALRESIPEEILNTDPAPGESIPLPTTASTGRTNGSSGQAWRAPTISADKTKLIGLAGEIIVGEWLRATFNLPPEDTWCSGYRADHLADGKGDDARGYDFLVRTQDKTLLYEVKATVDDTPQFTLGESEVRRANDLADDEEYRIVFVTHVLNPAKVRLRVLLNPFAAGGLASYQVVGRSIHLRFIPGS
jgi:uncharacterized protein DUF3883